MKIRPLPEIDLARIAPLPKDQQRRHLVQLLRGRPPFSYGPLRARFHDIFNVQPEMFGPVAPCDWPIVETLLGQTCRTEDELTANLEVARGLHQFAVEGNMLGRTKEFFPLAMGSGQKVSYWLPLILSHEGRPIVPFIDPRRSRGLTREGRRFVFSVMHERIRAADPDLKTVNFGIFQFGDLNEDRRNAILRMDDGVPLFSFETLETMVTATYELWREVCEEREMGLRQKATGTRGPLI